MAWQEGADFTNALKEAVKLHKAIVATTAAIEFAADEEAEANV